VASGWVRYEFWNGVPVPECVCVEWGEEWMIQDPLRRTLLNTDSSVPRFQEKGNKRNKIKKRKDKEKNKKKKK
jgi:hypothetical protein